MNAWEQITQTITDPKYKVICRSIGRKLGLGDDLYQELMLTMCEKIHSRSPSLESAHQNQYMDWYIIATARNLFHFNTGFKNKYRYDITGAVEFTGMDATFAPDNQEDEITWHGGMVRYDELLKACEDELGQIDWYNFELFRMHSQEGLSIRKISHRTRIPRNAVHLSLKATRRRLQERVTQQLTG